MRGNSTYGTVLQTNLNGIWAQNNGFELSDLTIEDTSGTGAVPALLRVSNALDLNLQRVQFNGAAGRHYTAGGVTVANGSAQVFGVKTVWTADMGPGHIWINGYCQEVAAVTSAATLTLATPWQHPSVTNAAYSLDYGGAGLQLDGNGGGCCQYGSVRDCIWVNNRVNVYAVGQAAKAGVSRIRFTGGRAGCFNNQRLQNSIAAWFGQFSDTCLWDVPVNNTALGVAIENGHSHVVRGYSENDQPYCPVTGMTTGQPATKGVLVTGTGTTAATNTLAAGISWLRKCLRMEHCWRV